ncbi:SH3 domain-containing kinase-binding protein 1-like [Ptychodera flava]|uniref:SH3 domain-containing kinase-binding protein 1-like n=1 Tax=Ptychodera flava TaxID=63121 RepID=UPI00396A8385
MHLSTSFFLANAVKRAKALFQYTPEKPDELGINEGDIVTVLSEDGGDHGWWKGELKGKVGVFPDNFVKLIEDEPERGLVHHPDQPQKPPPLSKSKQASVKRAKALFQYTPEKPDELGINEGDIVTVLSEDGGDHGWWKGELKGKVGVFPDNFVKLIEDEPERGLVHHPDQPQKPPPLSKSKPASVKRAKALFQYTPEKPDELGINEGDIVTVLSEDGGDHGWWKGELKGKVGVFPDNFVKLIEDEPERGLVHHPDQPQKPPPLSKSKPASVKRAKALFQYTPEKPDELGINEGDIVTVLSEDGGDHGWWKGELKGKVGVFPDNFVKLIEDEPERGLVHHPDQPQKPPPLSKSKPASGEPRS